MNNRKVFFIFALVFIFLCFSCNNGINNENIEEYNIKVFYKPEGNNGKILIYEGTDAKLYNKIKNSKHARFSSAVKTVINEGEYYIEIVNKNIIYCVKNNFDIFEEGKDDIIKCDVIPEMREYLIRYLYSKADNGKRGMYVVSDILHEVDKENYEIIQRIKNDRKLQNDKKLK